MSLQIGMSALSLGDRVEYLRTLAAWLVSSGGRMPVSEAIRNTCEAFSRDEYRSLAGRMNRIVSDYDSGQTHFNKALIAAKLGFTKQELTVLEAAENSNQLRVAVPAMVEAMQMRLDAQRNLTRKMAMPVISGIMLILMSLGVAIFMLPTILGPVLQRSPDALEKFPFIIQAFWAFSQWLRANWIVPVVFLLVPVMLVILRNTIIVKTWIESVVMHVAPLRRLAIAYNGVMLVYFMPALVRSGMQLPQVMRALSESLNNQSIANALRAAANEHEAGMRLGDALARLPMKGSFRSAIEAGEKTGAIADRVEDLKAPYAADYDRVVRRAVGALTMVVMGVLLPLFIISMYTSLVAPIFALMEY